MAKSKKPIEQRLAEAKAGNALTMERQRAQLLKKRGKAISAIGRGSSVDIGARYSSATRTRLRPGPRPSGGSAAKHLSASTRSALTRDCQDLERNSTIGRIVIRRAQQLIVGDGPIVRSTAKDKVAAAAYDRFWNGWADAEDPDLFGHPDVRGVLSFHEMLAAMISAWCTDGDVLFLRTTGGSLQMIEAERIVTPLGRTSSAATIEGITDGVEMDAVGAPVAYHIAEWDRYGVLDARKTQRRDASNAWLAINPIGVRAGFVRGEPALQAALTTIERLDSYIEKVGVAAEIATLFGAVVTDENPAELQDLFESGTDDQPATTNANAPREVQLDAGTIQYLGRSGKVTQIKPEFPTTSFREYVTHQVAIIGAELGIPLVAATYDSSQMSWSNIKAVLSLSSRSTEPAQARAARLVKWVRRWVLEWAIRHHGLPASDEFAECTVEFPRAPVVDFRSEVDGYKAAIDARLMTRDQAMQALGTGTFDRISEACAAEESRLSSLGIPAIQSPGATSSADASQDAGGDAGGGTGGNSKQPVSDDASEDDE